MKYNHFMAESSNNVDKCAWDLVLAKGTICQCEDDNSWLDAYIDWPRWLHFNSFSHYTASFFVYGWGFENNQHTTLDVINIPRCPNGGDGWSCSYRDRFGAKMAISQMWKCEAWLYLKFEWGEYFLCTTKKFIAIWPKIEFYDRNRNTWQHLQSEKIITYSANYFIIPTHKHEKLDNVKCKTI